MVLEFRRVLVRSATQDAHSLQLNTPPREIKRAAYADALIADIDIQQGISLVALANRPDVKVAEATLSNSFYAVNLANAAFYPSIKLGGTIGWTNSAGALISNPAGWLFSAIASLTQPIFNGGANRANLKIAKTQYEQSLIAFHKALLVAGTEVNDAISILQGSDAQAQLRKEQVIATQKAYDNSIQIMQNSSQTYLEVIASQGALLEAQIAELGNWMQGVQGRITLFKALGGGI